MLRRLNATYDAWLLQPELDIVRRLGLWRILYALFTLRFAAWLWRTPLADPATWQPVGVLRLFDAPPAEMLVGVWQALAIVGVMLLLVGYLPRTGTVLLLVGGGLLDSLSMCYGKVDHGTMLLAFYAPLVMLWSPWGASYSLFALKRDVIALDAERRALLACRVLLVTVVVLYASAGWSKLRGTWAAYPSVVSNIVLTQEALRLQRGDDPNPVIAAVAIAADHRAFNEVARWGVLVFEIGFPLALFSRRLRLLFISSATLTHVAIYVTMGISFLSSILIFLLFVDLQRPLRAMSSFRPPRLNTLAYHALGITLTLALVALWYFVGALEQWRFVLLPLDGLFVLAAVGGVAGWLYSLYVFIAPLWRRPHTVNHARA